VQQWLVVKSSHIIYEQRWPDIYLLTDYISFYYYITYTPTHIHRQWFMGEGNWQLSMYTPRNRRVRKGMRTFMRENALVIEDSNLIRLHNLS